MLRWTALALLLANLLVWGFNRGWLAPLGLAPAAERDPGRLSLQVRPELVRVVPPSAAPSTLPPAAGTPPEPAASATASTLACLESEPLAATALDAAEQTLAIVLPERGWIRASREIAPQYAVVMGPLARDALAKKLEELARLRVPAEELRLASDGGGAGLSLGRFDSQAGAQAALEAFVRRGVRTARVLQLREAMTEQRLRIENVAPDKVEALRSLRAPALGANGLIACAGAPR
jgi:hypothetical protein